MASVQAIRRVKYLDAFRGIAILLMIPLHLFLFGGGVEFTPGGGGGGGGVPTFILPIGLSRPLSTGIILFFFVAGFAVMESMFRRMDKQSLLKMELHVITRYGIYMLIGIAAELLITYFTNGFSDIWNQIQRIVGLSSLSLSQPIIGLSLSVMIAFPIMRYLSWKKLLVLALVWALAEGLIIYSVTFPREVFVRLLFANSFAVMKGIPMVLFGAAVCKALRGGNKIGKVLYYTSMAVALAYIVVPTFLGTGGWHMIYLLWEYPYAMTFVAAVGILLLGLFIRLEQKGKKLSALTVLGRSSFAAYYGHYVILFGVTTILKYLGMTITLPMLLLEMVVATIAIWIILYFVSKRKWGDPSTW